MNGRVLKIMLLQMFKGCIECSCSLSLMGTLMSTLEQSTLEQFQ